MFLNSLVGCGYPSPPLISHALFVCDLHTGAFIGVSLEGNLVATRMDANLRFYGDPYVTTSDILMGNVERPNAAKFLYTALDDLYSGLDC